MLVNRLDFSFYGSVKFSFNNNKNLNLEYNQGVHVVSDKFIFVWLIVKYISW